MNPSPRGLDLVERSLRRLRWTLTAWFTITVAAGLAALLAIMARIDGSGGAYDGAALPVALLSFLAACAVAAFALVTWVLLGYVLAPVTRSLGAQESFLATAAHDLRTPLATLSALLHTARRDPDAVDRAARLADRTGEVVEDLLARARLAAGTLPVSVRPARLDQLVEGVLADLAPGDTEPAFDADGSITLALDVNGHSITMTAAPVVATIDPPLVERAVANLVHNALRHGHRPGGPARIVVTVASVDGHPRVTVADAGPGLRPPVQRTGLGISLVRWVARVHGGALLLGAGPEPGTRIHLQLPAR